MSSHLLPHPGNTQSCGIQPHCIAALIPSALPEGRLLSHLSSQPDASLTSFPPLSQLPGQSLQNINWLYSTKKHSMAPHCFWANFYPPTFHDVASAYLSVSLFFLSPQTTLSSRHLELPVIFPLYHGVSSLCSELLLV